MSDAKKSEKKSVKKKHSSSSATKNKKNEDPPPVPGLPCDQRAQKLVPPSSLHPQPSFHQEHKICSPSKKPRAGSCSTPESLPTLQKKVPSVSSRDCSPPEVILKRTSSGTPYYKLGHSKKKQIESPDSGQSGSVSVVKRKADVQPGDEACSLKKKATCQKDETRTYKDEKKKKKKKTKSVKKDVSGKKQESAADELNKIQQKLGTFVNTFKIVTSPKENSADISARARAFEEYCDKRARLIKSRKIKSSLSKKGDSALKPLPSTTLNESFPHRENKERLPESDTPSSARTVNSMIVAPQWIATRYRTRSLLRDASELGDLLILGKKKLETTSSSDCFHDAEDLEEEMQIVEELVTARSEKKLDLAVAQTCGELTSMDIDSSEDDTHNLPVNASCTSLLIVIDTNIMIGHLQFIKTLKAMEIPGLGKPVLIIPWVVLQELDYMKNGKLLQTVKHKAIPAVDFIYICLKNQDSQLWGQSMQQASQKLYGLSAENNDDRVLHCCIQYQKLYPNARLLLCTDDKNLCNKAIVSDVKAVSKADLFAAMQNLLMTTVSQSSCITMPSFNEGQVSKTQTSDEISNPNESSPFRNVIADLEKCLGLALSKILETEMKMVFEDLWFELLFLKPPWTLSDLLQCFKKHWLAVFGMIVKRDLLQSVDYLYEHLCKGATIDLVLMKSVLQQCSMLLNAFISRSNYDGILPQACEQVGKLLETVSKVTDICLQSSSNPKEAVLESSAPVKHELEVKQPAMQNSQSFNRHQEIWVVLETLCNTVAQYSNEVFQKFTDIQELLLTQPNTNVLPVQEAFICLQKLMMAVTSILEGIQRILVPNSSPEEVWPLYNVLVNNEIHVTGFKFSAMELYECLSQNEYRQKLTIGCQQLAALEYTMKTLNESICFEAKSRGWM